MENYNDAEELDKVARSLFKNGDIKHITLSTPGGYHFEISEEKYFEAAKGNQNPITQIFNITSTAIATAKSSLTVSQEIQNIIQDLDNSGLSSKEFSEAKKNLEILESELNKPKPDEKLIRRIMRWASNFNLALALRIAILIRELLSE